MQRPREGWPEESLKECLEKNYGFLMRKDRSIERTAVIALYELNLHKENLIELLNHNSKEYDKLKKENEALEKDFDWAYEEINRLYQERFSLKEKIERLKEKNKELKNLVDSYSDNVKSYKRLGENETMRDPEDDNDVGKQLFSVKAKIKHYKADTCEYHFTNETEFVMAKGWANAAERFLRNKCLHTSEEIIEIEISHKPHIE